MNVPSCTMSCFHRHKTRLSLTKLRIKFLVFCMTGVKYLYKVLLNKLRHVFVHIYEKTHFLSLNVILLKRHMQQRHISIDKNCKLMKYPSKNGKMTQCAINLKSFIKKELSIFICKLQTNIQTQTYIYFPNEKIRTEINLILMHFLDF